MRLIDAEDILDSIENWKRKVLYYHPYTKKFSTIPMSEVLSFLEDSPTIDAVPVVRCKDCKWYDMSKCMVTTEMGHHYVCRAHSYRPVPEDYCSQGERKDDD